MTIRSLSISSLTRALATATFKDTSVVFIGNLISAILGAVFFFFLAHRMGLFAFGVFSVVIAVANTAVDLFDIGINNALVSFASKAEFRAAAIKEAVTKKALLCVAVTLLLWAGAPIFSFLFNRSDLTIPLRLGAWIVPAKVLFTLVKTIFQTLRKFIADAILEILSSIIRLGMFVVPVSQFPILPLAVLAYGGSLLAAALILLPLIWSTMTRSEKMGEKVPGFSTYQSWMSLAFLSSSVSSRLDVFFLTRFVGLEAVGLYQAAFRLFMPIQQLAGSLTRVFAPRLASFRNRGEAHVYLRKSLLLTALLAASMILVVPALPWAIPFLYGGKFNGAIPVAYGLLPYFMVFLFSTPWWSVLLYFHTRAKAFAVLSVLGLILLLLVLPSLILIFGIHGAAIALLVTNLLLTVAVARASRI